MAIGGILTGQARRDQDASNESKDEALNLLYNTPVAEETQWGWVEDPTTGAIVRRKVDPYSYGDPRTANANADPLDTQAQMSALNALQRAGSGQIEPGEYARRQAEDARLGSLQAGQAGAISQVGQETGQGSGYQATLAQGGAQQNNVASADLATQRAMGDRMRALQAMQDAAQLSSEVRGQGYRERSQQASAIDAFNAANTSNRRDTAMRDVNRQNERTKAISDARIGNAIRSEGQSMASQAAGQRTASGLTAAAGQAASRDKDTSGGNTYSGWKS